MNEQERPPKPGPEPERLKIDGDWEDAVKEALNKPKPAEGWGPEPPKDQEPEDDEAPAD